MQKGLKYIALALVLVGLILSWLAISKLFPSARSVHSPAATEKQEVQPLQRAVLLRVPVAAGQVLSEAEVELGEVRQRPASALEHVMQVNGRSVAQAMEPGEVVTEAHLLSGVVGKIAFGERAVAIKVEESTAVGHKIQAGDWVDVVVVFRKDGQEVAQTQAQRLFERKKVLAYGIDTEGDKTLLSAVADSKETGKKALAADARRAAVNSSLAATRTAVLLVKTEEVNALMLADRQGQIMLALRNPLEQLALASDAGALLGTTRPTDPVKGWEPVASQLLPLQRLAQTSHMSDSTGSKTLAVKELGRPAPSVPAQRVAAPQGRAVEVIRGVRSETLHY